MTATKTLLVATLFATGCAHNVRVQVDEQMVRYYRGQQRAILHGRKPDQLSDSELVLLGHATAESAAWAAMELSDAH